MTQSSNPPLARTSETLFEEAQRYIPGGVNSPVAPFEPSGHAAVHRSAGRRVQAL